MCLLTTTSFAGRERHRHGEQEISEEIFEEEIAEENEGRREHPEVEGRRRWRQLNALLASVAALVRTQVGEVAFDAQHPLVDVLAAAVLALGEVAFAAEQSLAVVVGRRSQSEIEKEAIGARR